MEHELSTYFSALKRFFHCLFFAVVAFTEGDLQYKTTEPSNSYDQFLHVVEGWLKSATLSLIPSLNFDPGMTPAMLNVAADYREPPPRKMGDGYRVIDTNKVEIKYLWDEPGRQFFYFDKFLIEHKNKQNFWLKFCVYFIFLTFYKPTCTFLGEKTMYASTKLCASLKA